MRKVDEYGVNDGREMQIWSTAFAISFISLMENDPLSGEDCDKCGDIADEAVRTYRKTMMRNPHL